MDKNFNIIIAGVGGQGLIKLVQIIDEAGFIEGYNLKSSEVHGLAQRGGSVLAHIRFGKKVYSPMVAKESADLIIATELTESLRTLQFVNKETKIIINDKVTPFLGGLSKEEILGKLPKKNLFLIEAPEKLGGVYLLGYAVKNGLIPLKEEAIIKAIEKIIPEKYLQLNIKTFKND